MSAPAPRQRPLTIPMLSPGMSSRIDDKAHLEMEDRSCMTGAFFTFLRLAMLVLITTGALLVYFSLAAMSSRWKTIYEIEVALMNETLLYLILIFGVILICFALVGCFFSMFKHKKKVVWVFIGVFGAMIMGLLLVTIGGKSAQSSADDKIYAAQIPVTDDRAGFVSDKEVETGRSFNLQYCESALVYYCREDGGRVGVGVDLFFPKMKEVVGDSANQVDGIMKYCKTAMVHPDFTEICKFCDEKVRKFTDEIYAFTDGMIMKDNQQIQTGCQANIDNVICQEPKKIKDSNPLQRNQPYFECREEIWLRLANFGNGFFTAGLIITIMSLAAVIFVILIQKRPQLETDQESVVFSNNQVHL